MPTNLFREAITSHKGGISLALISDLGGIFKASFPATAIRYVELSGEPVVLIFNGVGSPRRIWSSRSKRVPEHLWITSTLDSDTYAYDLLKASPSTKRYGKMPAEAWFDGIPDDRYELLEFSVRFEEGVYTLLHLSDERLLAERLLAKRSWSMDDDDE